MGWVTNFTGPQIDSGLEKGRNLKVVSNGWIKFDKQIDVNTIRNPGNYIAFNWLNGPEGVSGLSNINIVVTLINGTVYQFISDSYYTYSRVELDSEGTFSDWSIDRISGSIKVGIAPEYPLIGKSLWLDTSNAYAPSLKIYTESGWKETIPEGMMKSSIYDPDGKRSDIFKYIDDAIKSAISRSVEVDFDAHYNNSTVHITAEEVSEWTAAILREYVEVELPATIKSDIDNSINTDLGNNTDKFNSLNNELNTVSSLYESHINNTVIHPSTESINRWNSKAEREHTHNLDNRIMITPANVIGNIPENKVSYEAKEKVYNVESETELYSKTKNPIHNGDSFYIRNANGNTWYFVVDDSLLGKNNAENAFKKMAGTESISWENVVNAPTTLVEYGITDAASDKDVSEINSTLNNIKNKVPDSVDSDVDTVISIASTKTEADNMLSQLEEPFELLDSIINEYAKIGI